MSISNFGIGSIVTLGTLGLMVAATTVALGDNKATEPSNTTCIQYMEADQRYDEAKKRHREAQKRYQGVLANRDDSKKLTGVDILASIRVDDDAPLEQAKSQRRDEYLSAYRGVRSSNREVMDRLLNADRWRCCKKLEPNRRACPQQWL